MRSNKVLHPVQKQTNTWGLAGQPCFTPMLMSKAVDMDPPARTTDYV